MARNAITVAIAVTIAIAIRRICDIHDFFAPYTNVLTYLLTVGPTCTLCAKK